MDSMVEVAPAARVSRTSCVDGGTGIEPGLLIKGLADGDLSEYPLEVQFFKQKEWGNRRLKDTGCPHIRS